MEKLAQKQEEWEYFSKFKEDNSSLSPEEFETKLIENGFDDLEDFKKYMGSLERSLKGPTKEEKTTMKKRKLIHRVLGLWSIYQTTS